jgi:hypothetical protein
LRKSIVGEGIERCGHSDALAFEVDNRLGEAMTIETDLDRAVSKIGRRFKSDVFERKGVVFFDDAIFFSIEEFIGSL